MCFTFLSSWSISKDANIMYKPGKWQMERACLSPARVGPVVGKNVEKKLNLLIAQSFENAITNSRSSCRFAKARCWLWTSCVVKGGTPGRRKSRAGKLILVLKQGLEKVFWRMTGVGWGDWSATEVGKKWGIETQFIQCSSPAIDNLSTDISLEYFYPEGGSFYWKWGGFLKLSLQIRRKKEFRWQSYEDRMENNFPSCVCACNSRISV